MGLDQYWFSQKTKADPGERFHYHRKVPALQAFMENEWRNETGNESDDFNCIDFPITDDILDRLQKAVSERSLDHKASGFFWGVHDDDDYQDIQDAIDEARECLNNGLTVFYTSWW